MRVVTGRRVVGPVVVLAAVVGGCSDGGPRDGAPTVPAVTTGAPADDDAATAIAVCTALRDQTNRLADIATEAVAGIHSRSPDERVATLLDGFDAARAAAAEFAAAVPVWSVPPIAERDRLRAEVEDGARRAVDAAVDERAAFVAQVRTITDDDVTGRVGQFFNAIEKVMSVAEPAIAKYDRRELQAAFLAEPTCRHVIQPFQLDG